MSWSLGNGRSDSLVQDVWILELGSLLNHLLLGCTVSTQLKVVDFVDSVGCCKWSEFSNFFKSDILDFIAACCPLNVAFGEDSYLWS